ncbi:MAG TPA: aminoglycoside phosphotransferase family protein [Acidimicrobiales bacterium]|jgi:aminoglycoside phosphotransferase (APT) family kinase protein
MHHDEIDSDSGLVRRLLEAQRPQWADLPIEPVSSTGTDNALYRLGDHMVVRLPLRPSSVGPAEREHRWLAELAPHLPLDIPVPLARGHPVEGYPWPWSVYPWFEGEDATRAHVDLRQAAFDLAGFMAALQSLDPTGGPEPSMANFGRGVPLAMRDRETRQAISESHGLVDTAALTAAWERALSAPTWDRPPVWIHGDIAAANLLVRGGRLSAVIDWGALGIGDPACDLIVAWELLDAESREVLRTALAVDDATWARSRGWALSTAIVALPYYQHSNAFMAAQARHKLAVVLSE